MNDAERDAPVLARVGARPPLGRYLTEVWHRREFIFSLARYRIEAENQQNRLGMAWIVIRPIINAIVYGTVFGILLRDSRPEHFVEFLIIGVFLFEFFSSSFTQGAKSITSNRALVQSLAFPRISLPIAQIVQSFLQFVPMVVIMLLFVLAMGHRPTAAWLLLIPLSALFFCFNLGLALITARLTVHFRDLSQLLPFVTRLVFYTTGIFYSIEQRFKDSPLVLRIADFIPTHEFLDLGRDLLLEGPSYEVNPWYWAYASAWTVVLLVVGVLFFWAAEERYGRTD